MLFFGLWLKDVLIKPIKIIFHIGIFILTVIRIRFPVNSHFSLVITCMKTAMRRKSGICDTEIE
tara:strand:+ start:16916 stop:17107 length:192 start_codon:yes stop_codon:yes gene_type:complete